MKLYVLVFHKILFRLKINFALKVFVCVNELKSENHTLVVIPEPRFDFPSI